MINPESKPSWDSFIQQLIRDLEPWGQEQARRLFSATILDRDSQPLSIGQAIVADDGVLGTFWPQSGYLEGMNPKNVATLTASDGRRFELLTFSECPCKFGSRHFHFDSLPISPCQLRTAPMRVEAHVIKANGQTGFATFDSRDICGKIGLTLDRGQAPDKLPEYFHPTSGTLRDESGRVISTAGSLPPLCHYVGPPIDIRKYLDLPPGRRGFRLHD